MHEKQIVLWYVSKLGARSSNYTCDDVGFQILKPPRLVCLHDSNTSKVTVLMESCFSQLCGVILSHVQQLLGGLEHFLFSPIVGMMIQSDFHIFQLGRSATVFDNCCDDDLRSTM